MVYVYIVKSNKLLCYESEILQKILRDTKQHFLLIYGYVIVRNQLLNSNP